MNEFERIAAAVAPVVAGTAAEALLGGGKVAPAVLDAVVSAAEQVAGVKPVGVDQVADLAGRIIADDSVLATFHSAVNHNVAVAMAAETEQLRMRLADVQDARKREVASGDNTPRILAFTLVGGALAVSCALLYGALRGSEGLKDPTLATVVGAVFGHLFAEAKQVTAYYFGSSAGSKAKDERINGMTR